MAGQVGDIVRYQSGTALYLVTEVNADGTTTLTDMGSGRPWGAVASPLVVVASYAELHARSAPLLVWDVCPECGQAPGYGCREGNTIVEYLHDSRRTVPTSEASRIARAHERWLPATD